MKDKSLIVKHLVKSNPASSFPGCIDEDDVLAFDLDTSRRLLVDNGLLWVTIQNDTHDYLVRDREELDVPSGRKIVVEAVEPSCFELV
jgi:Protein of unknown function (DUF2917).